MKPIVVPDIHGAYLLLHDVLTRFPDRQFVFLGDLIDRGPDSHMVLRRVKELVHQKRALLCLGNHEDMAIQALLYHKPGMQSFWEQVGGAATTTAYGGVTEQLTNDLNWVRMHARRVIVHEGVMYCHAMRPALLDVTSSRIRQNYAAKHPTLALDTQAEEVIWGIPGKTPLHPLPEGIKYSVHGHTILDEPLIDLEHDKTVFLDLGGFSTLRFCVWDAETEQAVRIV